MIIGSVLQNRYYIESRVGMGGMQYVYLARDKKLNRDVALKTPIGRSASTRFARSAVLSAKVNHHNVAKTFDYFSEGGAEYLVEEYVAGENLQDFIKRFEGKFFDPYWCAKLLHHMAKGVAASHHVQVVHRDLKPSNVLVDGYGLDVIKISDFGIAKMAADVIDGEMDDVENDGDSSTRLSSTVLGALPFMAPENFESRDKVSYASDIWSLGAMTYYFLSGKYPYGEAAIKVLKKYAEKEKPRVIKSINGDVQFSILFDEVYRIVKSCMRYDQSKRPTADGLVDMCASLCYQAYSRKRGVVRAIDRNRGFIVTPSRTDVFFHRKCVYGNMPDVDDAVCYAAHPSNSAPRAYPVLVLKKEQK